MPGKKEILLYTEINSYSSSEFITAMNEAGDDDVCVRIACIGGNPDFAFGMIAKFKEHSGKKQIKVDGKAHSMSAFFLCYAEDVEALEVAEFVLHRAAYPEWFENNPEFFTADVRGNVERINAFLKKALEAKIDVAKFEAMKNVKMKDLFSLDSRIDVRLTAAEAKKIGLIDTIVKITPEKSAQIESMIAELTAKAHGIDMAAKTTPEIIKPKNMNLAELKSAHPAVYAEAVAEGLALGVTKEKTRVEACLVFLDIDPTGVKAAIESGADLNAKQMAEFSLKAMSPANLAKLGGDSAKEAVTAEAKEQTEKEKTAAEIEAKLDVALGLGEKK